MKELIRNILKEESLSNELLNVVNKEGIFSAAKLVGGLDNLKSIFKHNPEVLERIGGANGVVGLSYYVEGDTNINLEFDIIDEHWNRWGTNSWAGINIKYDESKLTKEEIYYFNSFIMDTFEMEGSFMVIHFDCPELKKRNSYNYLTVEKVNGKLVKVMPDYYEKKDEHRVKQIIDKLNN